MKIIAIFLLIACIFDLIKPLTIINKSRKDAGMSWISLRKYPAFFKYLMSAIVNVFGIVFFSIYLL